MKIKLQLVVCAEDGREEQVQEIAMVEKPHQQLERLHRCHGPSGVRICCYRPG